jgi:hypothetical protein
VSSDKGASYMGLPYEDIAPAQHRSGLVCVRLKRRLHGSGGLYRSLRTPHTCQDVCPLSPLSARERSSGYSKAPAVHASGFFTLAAESEAGIGGIDPDILGSAGFMRCMHC